MLTLHYAPHTISVAVAIALQELNIPHELIKVDFANGEQRSDHYLAINPKGRVPSLTTDQGVLTEAGAILEYLSQISDDKLVPKGAFQAAKMREMMFYLASTAHVNHAHKMRGARWADNADSHADMAAKVPQTMADSCAYLEKAGAFAPFAVGADMTLADAYLTVVLAWVPGDKVDLANYPRLNTYVTMMQDHASVRAVKDLGML